VIDNQNPGAARSAAWRAFWLKIRALNARETERRRNETDAHEQAEPAETDNGASLALFRDGEGNR
jgi:hypothetical protein